MHLVINTVDTFTLTCLAWLGPHCVTQWLATDRQAPLIPLFSVYLPPSLSPSLLPLSLPHLSGHHWDSFN